jgi:predicted Rossmann-fold nucleotide-binding protein
MDERKALMADLSDAFVALPGGFGTLEFCEVVTWTQLDLHAKPCGVLPNVSDAQPQSSCKKGLALLRFIPPTECEFQDS